jgi:exonuclease SbcC
MIPLKLTITGFLSYHETAELDFTTFDLACIAGQNGAGKSSLLDAITWVLFGQARRKDDALINTHSNAAEVCLIFAYEGNIYQVRRAKPRDKTAVLEFFVLQGTPVYPDGRNGLGSLEELLGGKKWKPLTERTLRETEARIGQTLRMDYETFVNAAFFLQGKADQFTQQRSGDRKRILGSILGLEVWEAYRQQAGEKRKALEGEISRLEGRLNEITQELAEEAARRERLKGLEKELQRLSKERELQETSLDNIRKIAATLAEQRKLVEALTRQLDSAQRQLEAARLREAERREEKESYAAMLGKAAEIEAAYAAWQASRAELESWEAVAERFREQEKRRVRPRDEINAARARLTQEAQTLRVQEKQVLAVRPEIISLKTQLGAAIQAVADAEACLKRRAALDSDLQLARKRQAEARAENPRLKTEMDEIKDRIDRLAHTDGAVCPLCGGPLDMESRENLVRELNGKGKELGDRYRANQALVRQVDGQVQDLEREMGSLAKAESVLVSQNQFAAQLSGKLEHLEAQQAEWQTSGRVRLQEIETHLEQEDFAPEARELLRQIDEELKAIGYDAAQHDLVRRREHAGRASELQLRALEQARAALAPLERETAELAAQLRFQEAEVARQQEDHAKAVAALKAAEDQAPDLEEAEAACFNLQEQENRLRMEVGAARQRVSVLDSMKVRRKELEFQREEHALVIARLRQLERAFGKDGVPALLIEQALPQIESKANEILERLSGGSMSVRFVTQAAYKDKTRSDLKETLDIQISDGAGVRDYEVFSGGESFRVNFAIRLALSEVLAQRAGARMQTLVIDEGFGSQDAMGRQRLLEAINMVRPDFAKILVISHIDELKDAFPYRVEVEKTERGSTVRVV